MADDLQSKAAEMMKKVLTVGVGTLFLTEESFRGLISEIKLPTELISALMESAGKNKAEILKTLPKELISNLLDRVDLASVIQDVLSRNEIELKVRIRFHPKKKKSNLPRSSRSRKNPQLG